MIVYGFFVPCNVFTRLFLGMINLILTGKSGISKVNHHKFGFA